MPIIRCQKCSLAYDFPPAVAVKLPVAIATCECGEALFGNKAALLARLFEGSQVEEIDVRPHRLSAQPPFPEAAATAVEEEPFDTGRARNIRIIARSSDESINTIFSIGDHPLWIGRKGCHIELEDPDLDIRHCSIERRKSDLVMRDSDSHTGSYLDGVAVSETVISDGTHLLRVGSALICLEPTDAPGIPVEPISTTTDELLQDSPLARKLMERGARVAEPLATARHAFLLCVEGLLKGKEFEIPQEGLTVGREGAVRVPDEYLSRKHFIVVRDEDGTLRVRDMGSRNGTFLNTLPAKNTKIRPGDEIQAGVNRFRVEER